MLGLIKTNYSLNLLHNLITNIKTKLSHFHHYFKATSLFFIWNINYQSKTIIQICLQKVLILCMVDLYVRSNYFLLIKYQINGMSAENFSINLLIWRPEDIFLVSILVSMMKCQLMKVCLRLTWHKSKNSRLRPAAPVLKY